VRDRDPPPPQHQSRAQEPAPFVRLEELLATALGGALAALLLSRLGVAGTIIGSALAPVIITVTSAFVSRGLSRKRDAMQATAGRGAPSLSEPFRPVAPGRRQLLSALVTAAAAFAIAAIGISVAEAIVGKPVDKWGHHGGSGYTFGGRESIQRSPSSDNHTAPTTTTTGGRERPPKPNTTASPAAGRADRHPRTRSAPTATPERPAPGRAEGEPGPASTTPSDSNLPPSTSPVP
jgi:hypothetical protein